MHSPALNVDFTALVTQRGGLRRDDLKIIVYATLISIAQNLKRFPRGSDGFALLPVFILKNSKRRQIILHLPAKIVHVNQ